MISDGDQERSSRYILLSDNYKIIGIGGWSLLGTSGVLALLIAEEVRIPENKIETVQFTRGFQEVECRQFKTPTRIIDQAAWR